MTKTNSKQIREGILHLLAFAPFALTTHNVIKHEGHISIAIGFGLMALIHIISALVCFGRVLPAKETHEQTSA